jgi:hypothetical protein
MSYNFLHKLDFLSYGVNKNTVSTVLFKKLHISSFLNLAGDICQLAMGEWIAH